MEYLNTLSLFLDIFLVVAAVTTYLARPRIGGRLAKGLGILLVGVMVLGLAHLIETALFAVVHVSLELNEVLHRLLIAIGFVFVIIGFLTMRRAFEE
jgi:hypothetical protein